MHVGHQVNVGSHTGGYGSFAIDVTDAVISGEGQDQELIIQVSHIPCLFEVPQFPSEALSTDWSFGTKSARAE